MDVERLGKYEIRSTLGRGAMGTVYQAWDPVIDRLVAIKTVKLPDASDTEAQEELARFKREAQAAGRLHHPNIVGVFDYGETDTLAYIVMEYVPGRTLKGMMDAEERLTLPAIGQVMQDLLAGLRYSHERGVIHRDIKPANVMVTETGQAKIADFGIARLESSNLTQAGTIMGTPAYMSPEQFMGQTVDARTDIYSSGVMLFQLLTGDRPFEGSMATIMHKALHTTPPKPSDLSVTAPVALDAVVAKAMARRPEERYPTAETFAVALKQGLEAPAGGLGVGLGDELADGDATVISTAAKRPQRQAEPERKRPDQAPKPKSGMPVLPIVAGVVVLALAGGGAWWVFAPGPTPPPTPPPTPTPRIADNTPPPTPTPPTPIPVPPPTPTPTPQPVPTPTPTPNPPPPSTPTPPTPVTPTPVTPTPTTPPGREPGRPLPPLTPAPPATPPAVIPLAAPPQVTPVIPPQPASPPANVVPPAPVQPRPEPPPTLSPPPPPPPVTSVIPAQPTPPQGVQPEPAAPLTGPPATVTPSLPSVLPIPTTPPAPPGPTAFAPSFEAMRQAVIRAVSAADCSVVTGDMVRPGTVMLRGVIGAGTPETGLHQALQDAAPTATVDWNLSVAQGPYCPALNLIRPFARPYGTQLSAVQPRLLNDRTDLVTDDLLIVRVMMPDFAGHLQLDYFASDGSVIHLNSAMPGPALPANSTHRYGDPKTGFEGWKVFDPYGTDIIVATVASTPLFEKNQALSEDAATYLPQLRAAMEAAGRRRSLLSTGVIMVRTTKKP